MGEQLHVKSLNFESCGSPHEICGLVVWGPPFATKYWTGIAGLIRTMPWRRSSPSETLGCKIWMKAGRVFMEIRVTFRVSWAEDYIHETMLMRRPKCRRGHAANLCHWLCDAGESLVTTHALKISATFRSFLG